jgi:hypothetical protein
MPIPAEARPLPSDPIAANDSLVAKESLADDATVADDTPVEEALAADAPAEESLSDDAPLIADAPTEEVLATDAPLTADVPNEESLSDDAPIESGEAPLALAQSDSRATAEPSELVEQQPEIKLFPPSLDSLVPPRRTLDFPLLSSSAKPATTSEAPWFVSVEPPKTARFPRAHHFVLAALVVVAAVAVGSIAARPSTGQVLVTVGGPEDVAVAGAVVYVNGERACAPAPCRVTVPFGSHLVGVSAPSYQRPVEKALAVGRGGEAAIHFKLRPEATPEAPAPPPAPVAEAPSVEPPTAEVVSVGDLRVRPEPMKPSLGAQPAGVSPVVPHIDLDGPTESSALASSQLTLTSNPPCNVVLDGRPLGTTPREVTVSAGAHAVVFIHPTKGRKAVRVEAVDGKAAVAAVTF